MYCLPLRRQNNMKAFSKNIVPLLLVSVLYCACGKKVKELTPAQIKAKADSIAQIKIKSLQQQAKEDLDKRMSIELKPKVDSLRNISHEIQAPPTIQQDGMEYEAEDTENDTDTVKK